MRTATEPAKSQPAKALWIPRGEAVTIQGLKIPGGMIYVGEKLAGASRYTPEPALINPKLPVNFHNPDRKGSQWMYWPAYASITPEARAAYLEWLAKGRGPGVFSAYLMLYFYGIERRVFSDAMRLEDAKADVPALIAEVERLLPLYRQDYTFQEHGRRFLVAATRIHGIVNLMSGEPPTTRYGIALSMDLLLGLGSFVAHQKPIPSAWALAWFRNHPDARVRTPAIRCDTEFDELFKIRYTESYGPGMVVKRNKKTLDFTYRPANLGFLHAVSLPAGDIPDVSRLVGPLNKLQEVAEGVQTELDAYSRHLALYPSSRGKDLWALSALPAPLLAKRKTTAVEELEAFASQALGAHESAEIDRDGLLARWKPIDGKHSAKDATPLARLLGSLGFGIEPDPRYSGDNFIERGNPILFQLGGSDEKSFGHFDSARLRLQLGLLLALSGGPLIPAKVKAIVSGAVEGLQLSEPYQRRVRAHFIWLSGNPPKAMNIRARTASLGEDERQDLARFLIRVATAGGAAGVAEIAFLTRAYAQLRLPPERVHADIHAAVTHADQPVTIVPSEPTKGFKIPKGGKKSKLVELDRQRLDSVARSTKAVEELLSTVFSSDETEVAAPLMQVTTASTHTSEGELAVSLPPACKELLHTLAQQPSWSRDQLQRVATDLGLILGGAIELLNEASFMLTDEPLLEDGDVIEVNSTALESLLKHVG